MLRRFAMGIGGLFLLTAAALASMVRIVPADAPKPAVAQEQPIAVANNPSTAATPFMGMPEGRTVGIVR